MKLYGMVWCSLVQLHSIKTSHGRCDPQAPIGEYWGLLGPIGVFGVGGVSFKEGSYEH